MPGSGPDGGAGQVSRRYAPGADRRAPTPVSASDRHRDVHDRADAAGSDSASVLAGGDEHPADPDALSALVITSQICSAAELFFPRSATGDISNRSIDRDGMTRPIPAPPISQAR